MRQIKSRAFILEKDAQNRDEGRLLLLSRDFGLIWLTATGIFKPGAKLATLTDPPVLAEAEVLLAEDERNGRLTTVSVENFCEHLKKDYRNRIWFSFFVYLLRNFTGESDSKKNFALFEEVVSGVENWREEDRINCTVIYFILKILRGEGLLSSPEHCLACEKKFSETEKTFYALGETGLLCASCFRQSKIDPDFQKNISFDYLEFTPLTELIPRPEKDFGVSGEVRNLLIQAEKSPDLESCYTKIFLGSKINGQLILQSRNFLLYSLVSLI
jgi:recombinational DNA repair protein (RecF pathway)